MQQSLDDILFEKRNKEYGSYRLRKKYFERLGISFIIAITSVLLFILGYFLFLNTGGDSTVYLYTSSNPSMKSTQGSLMNRADLDALMAPQKSPEEKADQPVNKPRDVLHDFKVSDKPSPDTFIQKEEKEEPETPKQAVMQPLLTVRFSEAIYLETEKKEGVDQDWISFPNSREEQMLSGVILNSL